MVHRSSAEALATFPIPIQNLMRAPVWWASIASIGLHGILLALLPFISMPTFIDDDPELQRQVSVVELTPEELERVPDFSSPQIDIPPIPEGDDFYSFDNYTNENFSDLDDPQASPIEPLPGFDPIPSPPPLRFSWPPPPPSTTFNPPTPAVPQPSPTDPPQPADPPMTPETPIQEQPQNSETPPETPTVEEAEPPTDTPEQQAAVTESPTERLLAEQAQLQEVFTYNAEGTSTDEANVAFSLWFYEGLGKRLEQLQRIDLTPPFPMSACPIWKGEEITAVYGVNVGANGEVDEPVLIQSSGYEFFNQEALKAIENSEFMKTPSPNQTALMTVRFVYDEMSCPVADPS